MAKVNIKDSDFVELNLFSPSGMPGVWDRCNITFIYEIAKHWSPVAEGIEKYDVFSNFNSDTKNIRVMNKTLQDWEEFLQSYYARKNIDTKVDELLK